MKSIDYSMVAQRSHSNILTKFKRNLKKLKIHKRIKNKIKNTKKLETKFKIKIVNKKIEIKIN
jgi:hypothetical protein